MSTSDTRDRLSALLSGPLSSIGLDLEGVDLSTAGKRRVLRVAVDRDGGVSMDDIAEATRQVGSLLDSSEVMGDRPYTLEVSSPGVDRPLTLPRHWRRNVGRLVAVTPLEGEAFTGRLTATGDRSATLDVGGTSRDVRFDQVRRAKVQIEFKSRDQ